MATRYVLTIDRVAVGLIGGDAAFADVTDVTRRVFNRATVLTPVDTGRLRAGNQMRVTRAGPIARGEVWNDTAYAAPVHDGVRAHTIRPRTAKVLRFTVGGEVVFARWAKIPARRGRPWILRAVQEIAVPRGYKLTTT